MFDAGFVIVPLFKPYHIREGVNLEVIFEVNSEKVYWVAWVH